MTSVPPASADTREQAGTSRSGRATLRPVLPNFSAELVEQAPLGPRVVKLTFEAAEPFPRAAGQYAIFMTAEGSKHAFSIASPFTTDAPRQFEIAVARRTTAEGLLRLPVGSSVTVNGPRGSLVWKGEAPSLLVATGTGISPLRALVKEQLSRHTATALVLLFGCRNATEELWGSELQELSLVHPRFRFLPIHSQPLAGHTGRIGRVQEYLQELTRQLGPTLRAYLCGHRPMVSDCRRLLLEHGVAMQHIDGES